jgi:hypothetical protein
MQMTSKMKFCFTAMAFVVAMLTAVPNAHAHACAGNNAITCHATGAGSSAQFLTAMAGADELAYSLTSSNTDGNCSFHWSGKNAANVLDPRDGSQLHAELGNVWVVWVAKQDGGTCATSAGGTSITDIWLDVSVDSTVGVRTFMAQLGAGQANAGALVQIPAPAPPGANLVNKALLSDGYADVALPSGVQTAIGEGTSGNDHVNLGLTDIRPEDALFATARAYAGTTGGDCSTTCAELGYGTSDAYIGIGILTDMSTGTAAYPTGFALSGDDPFTGASVRSYKTVPIGAAPIVFIYNNNSANNGDTAWPLDLTTGIKPDTAGGPYLLSELFEGIGACASNNSAFANNGGFTAVRNINLALREGLSGTMNTTEWNLFRSDHDTDGSQEHGIKPSLGSGPPGSSNNPLDLNCASGGKRVRGIGTGEIVNYINNPVSFGAATPNALGYIFFGFSNLSKVIGSNNAANYNYMTLDGVDPIALAPANQGPNQQLYNCAGPTCPATLWTNGITFPNVRNGSYKAWSLYRWVVDPNDDDATGGPSVLAQHTQNNVDSKVADYIPFVTTNGSDPGLDVYRSHFERCFVAKYPCPANGTLTPPDCPTGLQGAHCNYIIPVNGAVSGNTLGGGDEAGGDVGGLVYVGGPNPPAGNLTGFPASGTVKVLPSGEVQWVSGVKFEGWAATTSADNNTVTIDGNTCTIGVTGHESVTTTFYVTLGGACNPATYTTTHKNIDSYTYDVQTPGVLTKVQ